MNIPKARRITNIWYKGNNKACAGVLHSGKEKNMTMTTTNKLEHNLKKQ